jgi:hypothetical protein
MKYRPTPLNILALLLIIKYIAIFIRALNHGHNNGSIRSTEIIQLVLGTSVAALFLGLDYMLQSEWRGKKYVGIFFIELCIISAIVLMLYYGYNITSLHELIHSTIFDLIK